MSSKQNLPSTTQRKHDNQEEKELEKRFNFTHRQYSSQPILPQDQVKTLSTPIYGQQRIGLNLPEVIFLPRISLASNSSSNFELDQTAARIRNSLSSFRILVQSNNGHNHIAYVDSNSNNTDENNQQRNTQSNSLSTWPV